MSLTFIDYLKGLFLRYKRTKLITLFGVFILVLLLANNLSLMYNQPPIVKFELPVPYYADATEFTYSLNINHFAVAIDETQGLDGTATGGVDRLPMQQGLKFVGSGRVGQELTLTVNYYSQNNETKQVGYNIETKPESMSVHAFTETYIITQTDDQILGVIDFGNSIIFGIFVVSLIGFLVLFAVAYYLEKPDADRFIETKRKHRERLLD